MESENLSRRSFNELGLLVSDQVTAMLAYWDKELICRFANNAYRDWFGKSREDMIDHIHISELLGPLFEKNLPYIKKVLAGKKQIFERDIPKPDGSGIRHSLATYIPDFANGEVIGFFVHVADVTHIKNLEKEVIEAKREMLRNIIATEENNNRYLVGMLRESINQRLAACKLLMEKQKENNTNTWKEVNAYISETIVEINSICEELTPSEIEIFGLIKSLNIYAGKISNQNPVVIEFKCDVNQIEQIGINDKLSIFRILQNLISLCISSGEKERMQLYLLYNEPHVTINFEYSGKMKLKRDSKEFRSVECRVEYYGGVITTTDTKNKTKLKIDFMLKNQ